MKAQQHLEITVLQVLSVFQYQIGQLRREAWGFVGRSLLFVDLPDDADLANGLRLPGQVPGRAHVFAALTWTSFADPDRSFACYEQGGTWMNFAFQ